jgi:uncharacterized protein YggE
MKENMFRTVSVVGAALVVILTIVAWTDEQPAYQEPRLITVTGDAEVRVVPDEVILTLGVETWDKNMELAKRQNDEIVARVLALATDFGIAPEHIQTDYVGIEPRYRNGYYEERDFIGYFVHKTVEITLRDLEKFEDLLADVLEAGVNYVHGIQFRTTELREHRDEARALAIRAAKEKAEALAGELGQEVGDPILIQEVQSSWWSGYNSWWGSTWGNGMSQNVIQEIGTGALVGDGSLAPGQISVTARVSVTFQLTQ